MVWLKKIIDFIFIKFGFYVYFSLKRNRWAFVSFLYHPLYRKKHLHPNELELDIIKSVLSELGYNIIFVDYRSSLIFRYIKFDLIFGLGSPFERRIVSKKRSYFIRYATGAHDFYQEKVAYERLASYYKKYNAIRLTSIRTVDAYCPKQLFLSDKIIAIGDDFNYTEFSKYHHDVVMLPAVISTEIGYQENKVIDSSFTDTYNFLWLGGSGVLHKGLDVCLEYFKRNVHYKLHVLGVSKSESSIYSDIGVEDCENIIDYGFIPMKDERFNEILSLCKYVIQPSCSEGQATSILNAALRADLLPIVTSACGVNHLPNRYIIESIDVDSLSIAIDKAISDISEHKKKCYENREFIFENNSSQSFRNNMKNAMEILRE